MGFVLQPFFLIFFFHVSQSEYIPPAPRYLCPKNAYYLSPCICDEESDIGIYMSCKNTNIAKISVALNNLAEFKLPVERLTLQKCHIARLFGSLFYKVPVRVLHIEDTPIETIDEYTFLGINKTLNELHIVNSNLIEFPKLAIKILGNLTVLRIHGHNITALPKDAFAESQLSGKLLRLHISNGSLSTPPIESFQTLRKLKTLDLHENKINDLKRNQFKGLRELEVLDISHNNINKLEGGHIMDLVKVGWINVSHNSISDISKGAFARNSLLKLLNMSNNKIKKLDSNSFKGMRFLRRLFLSDNLISDVGRGTFSGIVKIGTIDLARNFIKKIDYQMFHQLNFIEVIDVSSNNVTIIEKLAFKDIYLSNINISHNAIETIEDGAFENCANMTVLDLSHNKLKQLSKNSFDPGTYATELLLSYNFFTDLSTVPLHNMTGLKILNVSHNEIIKIPKNTFPKLYELHTIDLSYNNISDIFNSVLQTLFSLRTVDLGHNNLETIKPSTFGALPTLLSLDLSYNNMRDIARGSLTRLASMRTLTLKGNNLQNLFQLPISVSHLDLSYNQISNLPPKFWPSMNSLLSLDLSHNMLEDNLGQGSFQNLLTLQKLVLNDNGITKPPWMALNDLSSLQYLYLENNKITELSRSAFGVLPVVFELNLAHNKISNISVKAFDGLLQLLTLNLTNNELRYIPNGAFQGLVSLRTLDLARNEIENLDNKTHGLLDDCISLEKLNLSYNRMTFITRKTFPSNPYIPYKLKNVDLSFNNIPLVTYDFVFGTSKLEILNLSHNSIADIRRYVLGNFTNLQVLDLSHNTLEDLTSDKDVFILPSNISQLILAHNVLNELPWKEVTKVSNLKVLDLRYNNFSAFNHQINTLVKNGSSVLLEGNPLHCDCISRPSRRYFDNLLELPQFYSTLRCNTPSYLKGKYLHQIHDDSLNCGKNVNFTKGVDSAEYDVAADIKLREVNMFKDNLKVTWGVVKNEDIADPYIVIRKINDLQNAVYAKTLPYFQRKLELSMTKANITKIKSAKRDYEICVIARNSLGNVRNYYKTQCRSFESVASRGAGGFFQAYWSLTYIFLFSLQYLLPCV